MLKILTSLLVGYQIIYFYIICRYLRHKLKNLNQSLKSQTTIRPILRKFSSLYHEISEYNTTYWSKLLMNIWFNYGTLVIIMINIQIKSSTLMFLIMIHSTLMYASSFLYIIMRAASINNEANKSYKLLNSIDCKRLRCKTRFGLILKLEVK